MSNLTSAQVRAVQASGNVLLVAGAGTGKTHTLIQRCLRFLCDAKQAGALDRLLLVTFTEAAGQEMRARLRLELERSIQADVGNAHLKEQLALIDHAAIGTLHSFCLRIVRENFYALGLDPQIALLTPSDRAAMAERVLDDLLGEVCGSGCAEHESICRLISEFGRGRDQPIRDAALKIHDYAQTQPFPEQWLDQQEARFVAHGKGWKDWEEWLGDEIALWRKYWIELLPLEPAESVTAWAILKALQKAPEKLSRDAATAFFAEVNQIGSYWPRGTADYRKGIEALLKDAAFLESLFTGGSDPGPVQQDWEWAARHMIPLLNLVRQFAQRFRQTKISAGALDFHDLEQFALRVLYDDSGNETAIAQRWQEQLQLVFVDEFQDINAAQEKVLHAVSGNEGRRTRFRVGDVKQSIYRFRLADSKIFLRLQERWKRDGAGEVIHLAENFRSHESILDFVNGVFGELMTEELGGLPYAPEDRLTVGARNERPAFLRADKDLPRVECMVTLDPAKDEGETDDAPVLAEVSSDEAEIGTVARRIKEIVEQGTEITTRAGTRPARFSDVVVLTRAPGSTTSSFYRAFRRAGVPLSVPVGNLFQCIEVLDLLHALQILDNPLQDLPLLAVLRSPLVGLSDADLVRIRLENRKVSFWTALNGFVGNCVEDPVRPIVVSFISNHQRWRETARFEGAARALEQILRDTAYEHSLAQHEDAEQRVNNVQQFVQKVRDLERSHRSGLEGLVNFLEREQEDEETNAAAVAAGDSVRLMSIHKSKGLEFPLVVVCLLGRRFNFRDEQGLFLLHDSFGICPQIQPPGSHRRYPSPAFWVAKRRHHAEALGEELRLLYVAFTRAIDRLILSGRPSSRKRFDAWCENAGLGPVPAKTLSASSAFDWMGPWLIRQVAATGADPKAPAVTRLFLWAPMELARKAEEDAGETPLFNTEAIPTLASLQFSYPFIAATRTPAKGSVSSLKQQREDEESSPLVQRFLPSAQVAGGVAAKIGTLTHALLERLPIDEPLNGESVQRALEKLMEKDPSNREHLRSVDVEAIEAFWSSPVGAQLRANATELKRELPFTVRLSVTELFPQMPASMEKDFVVVQGVVDLAWIQSDAIWIVDFKTDRIDASGLDERVEKYSAQLNLYATALEKIYRRPVRRRSLYFLALRQFVDVADVTTTSTGP